jgi:glycopeptide antibiotics resistance protein
MDPSEWRRWANLVPFGTIGPQMEAGLASGVRQLVGNLLILVPFGLGLPLVWHGFVGSFRRCWLVSEWRWASNSVRQ